MKHIALVFSILVLSSWAAVAQTADNAGTQERMDRLEHDLMLLQRQIARGETPAVPPGSSTDVPPAGAASLEVRLSNIEDGLRQLRGKVEENEFQVKKLSDALDKMQRDNDLHFSQLSAPPASPDAEAKPKPSFKPPAETPAAPEQPTGPTSAGDGVLKPPAANPGADQNFASPREHYNYAFRLLNQTKYDEAAKIFDSFTKKYPKDPLVGNAFYWEGETYYIRRDFVSAADDFRQGFEALPDGPKAADNLLKLAMSLNALGRDKEACVVLGQITTKFKQTSTSVNAKAVQEQKQIGCK